MRGFKMCKTVNMLSFCENHCNFCNVVHRDDAENVFMYLSSEFLRGQ